MICPKSTPIVGELQTLSLNRGTSIKYKAQRKDVEGQPILVKAEEVYFTVKKRWTDSEPLLQKDLSNMDFDSEGYYHFEIEPEDTENLPYGRYVWDFTVVDSSDTYRAKPAHGYLIIGNSAGWIANETE